MHIPEDAFDYREKLYFAPGDLGFRTFKTAYGKIGVLICWDQWFPEAARITALAGADIIFYPTAIGWLPSADRKLNEKELSAWETIQRSHGIASGIFIASVNRVGREKNIDFWGSSFVSGPFGETIAKASSDKDEILMAKCDLGLIEETRQAWPFLRDRRVDAYKDITSRFLE
jgi:N-carbamoylputrescine amidase